LLFQITLAESADSVRICRYRSVGFLFADELRDRGRKPG